MLNVHSPPRIEPERSSGWEILFWLGGGFDYSTPFRAALAEIVEILGRSGPASIDLPLAAPDEDFIEGRLEFQGDSVDVYFEYALGYLSLMSSRREVLEALATRVFPFVRVR